MSSEIANNAGQTDKSTSEIVNNVTVIAHNALFIRCFYTLYVIFVAFFYNMAGMFAYFETVVRYNTEPINNKAGLSSNIYSL